MPDHHVDVCLAFLHPALVAPPRDRRCVWQRVDLDATVRLGPPAGQPDEPNCLHPVRVGTHLFLRDRAWNSASSPVTSAGWTSMTRAPSPFSTQARSPEKDMVVSTGSTSIDQSPASDKGPASGPPPQPVSDAAAVTAKASDLAVMKRERRIATLGWRGRRQEQAIVRVEPTRRDQSGGTIPAYNYTARWALVGRSAVR